MRTMKATFENKKCGGTNEANRNDRSFDTSKAENIGDIRKDTVWIFPDGETPRKIKNLQKHELRDFELEYYSNRFGSAIEAQRERHLKNRQKSRAEQCTVKRYYDSITTGPDSTILQVGKEWEYTDERKFFQMAKILRRDIEEENEEARIKVLSISIHASEDNGSLHIHMTKSFEVKGKDGWIQNQEECLKKLGYKLPDESKNKGQYNNRKMTWTDQIRQRWYDIIEEVDKDIKIDRTPDPQNPKTKGKVNRAITQMNELKKQIRELQNEYKTLQREMRSLSKEDRKKREEAIRKSLDKIGKVLGTLSDYVGENELVDPLKDLHAYETLEKKYDTNDLDR